MLLASRPASFVSAFVSAFAFASACLMLVPAPVAAQNADPKPPKNAVTIDTSTTTLNGTGLALGSATLRRGGKKQILRVDLRVVFRDSIDFSVSGLAEVSVNGVDLPLSYANGSTCGPSSPCSVDAFGWLDLDAIEDEFPGEFVGRPLAIVVSGNMNAQTGSGSIDVALLAQLIRK